MSALMTWAYDGCRSSRLGGWTLTRGSAVREDWPFGTGALPVSMSPFISVEEVVVEMDVEVADSY